MAKSPPQTLKPLTHMLGNLGVHSLGGGAPASLSIKQEFVSGPVKFEYTSHESSRPSPQRRYVADVCTVQKRHGDVRLVFGQEGLMGDSLETALVVRMNAHAALDLVKSVDEMTSPSLQEIAAAMKLQPAPKFVLSVAPSQVASVVANAPTVAISGYDTCIDFFHASPFELNKAKVGGEIAVEGIVRVDLSTSLFLTLVEELRITVNELGHPALGE